jgi:hypothetical protein
MSQEHLLYSLEILAFLRTLLEEAKMLDKQISSSLAPKLISIISQIITIQYLQDYETCSQRIHH